MKMRLQKKHKKLLQENKLLKGNLGRQLEQELGRLPIRNRQDIALIQDEIGDLQMGQSLNRMAIEREIQNRRLLHREVVQLQHEVRCLSNRLIMVGGTVAICIFGLAIMLL